MSKIQTWAIIAVVAVVAVFGAGWFLAVSPQHAKVKSINAATAAEQLSNDSLQSQINALMAEQKKGTAELKRIADIQNEIPATPELPLLVRTVSKNASDSHVILVSMAPQGAAPVALAKTQAAAPAAAASGSADATAAPAPAAPAGAAMSAMTVTIIVSGDYFSTQQFVQHLEKDTRAMLITQIAVQPGSVPAGVEPVPSPAPPTWKTLQTQITATIFISAPTAGAAAGGAATTAPNAAVPNATASPSAAATSSAAANS
jgi:hypothetical protein